MSVKYRFLVTMVVILTSIAILAFGIKNKGQQGSIIVIDLVKVKKKPQNFYDREIRIRGFVKPASILHQSGDRVQFIMQQEDAKLSVSYLGNTQLPDTFTDGAPIRVDGKLNDDEHFIATHIEAKCASKYTLPYDKPVQTSPYQIHTE